MNERIRELAEQAKFTWVENDKDITGGVDLEKFAELIVQECMKQSLEEMVSYKEIADEADDKLKEFFKGNNQGIIDVICRIKNHFGVEE